jgi:hypothetical protein
MFIVVNSFVHTIMYGYYFLSEVGYRPPNFVAKLITIIQICQMIIGVASLLGYIYGWLSTGTP